MTAPEEPDLPPEPTGKQVTELLDALGDTRVVENDEFKRFLDHIPIAIAISKSAGGRHRICYANPAFEALMDGALAGCRDWSIFAGFRSETTMRRWSTQLPRAAKIFWARSAASSRNPRSSKPMPG